MGTVLALGLLGVMAASGMALLDRLRGRLGIELLEVIAFGAPLGVVLGSLLLLALAVAFGLTPFTVLLVAAMSAGGAIALAWPAAVARTPRSPGREAGGGRRRVTRLVPAEPTLGVAAAAPSPRVAPLLSTARRCGIFPILTLTLLTVRWAFLWSSALEVDAVGLWAGQINIWGDWSQHLGDVAAFAWGDNFPPDHPRFAGVPYAYHYLSSLTAAAMVEVGMSPAGALTLHSFVFSILVALGVFAFARRLTRDRDAAALALVFFLLGGGLGWLLVAGDANRSGDVWATLRERPWDLGEQLAANFRWQNVYFSSILPQRAFLYGIPLALLTFTLLHAALGRDADRFAWRDWLAWRGWQSWWRSGAWAGFAAAGAVAVLLPFAHLGPLPLLALVAATLFVLFPGRGWVVFGAAWLALALPQLLLSGAREGGDATSLRWDRGWLADGEPWWWFWLKNLGAFLPLLAVALLDRRLLSPLNRRFLWAFMPIFVIANLVVFQPDPWDNAKLLVFWYLAASILVAAALVRAWQARPDPLIRTLIAGVVGTMLLSGLLVNYQQAAGKDRYLLLTTEELVLAERVRAETPTDAIFAVGFNSNNPVVLLGGRRVVMSYPGWLWPRGLDYAQRERDLRALYALTPDAGAIIQSYGIDYVLVGPWELGNLGVDPTAWRARYPVAIETPSYVVFDVRTEE